MPPVTRSTTRARERERDRSKRMSVLRIQSARRARHVGARALRQAKHLRNVSAGFPAGSYWADVHDHQAQLVQQIRPQLKSADAAYKGSVVELAREMLIARQGRGRRRVRRVRRRPRVAPSRRRRR